MKGVFFSLLLLLTTQIIAQNAYDQWVAVQDDEFHLMTTYKEKRMYGSKGERENLLLRQLRVAKNGRLIRDLVYEANSTRIAYDLTVNYQSPSEAIGINALDTSKVTYSFTENGKIRYYVDNRVSTMHVIYTYNNHGQLIRCKDCLNAPKGHEWCLYYTYEYNEAQQLVKANTYDLKKYQKVEEKVLSSKDSLIYKDNLLLERWALTAEGVPTKKFVYHYDKKGKLEQEAGQLVPPYRVFRNYTIIYDYYCNGKLKREQKSYFLEGTLEYKSIIDYDKKGRKKQQQGFNAQDKRSSLYTFKYK